MPENFDAVIIGAGQAGPALAGRLDAAGKRVAILERDQVGGTCVNTGCMPTKTLIASAKAAHMARRGADFGFAVSTAAMDMPAVAARAGKVIAHSRANVEAWISGMSNVELIHGHGTFVSATEVEVAGRRLRASQIFINVGARASIPPMHGSERVKLLTNVDMVALKELPQHLVVIGGSYIGLEFAQMYRRFGSQVTIIERASRIIAREDEDVSAEVRSILEDEGIRIITDADSISFAPLAGGIAVTLGDDGDTISASHVLVAVGRTPNTDSLGLDCAGIAKDERGHIIVDDKLQTNVRGVYALGDCNGRGAFTHTAYNDFEIVAANLIDHDDRRLSQRLSSYALFVDPPLGRVGMTEAEARAKGHKVIVSKRPMTRVGRAVEQGETKGFMKIIADAGSRRILGAAVLGIYGDEVVHGIVDMMNADQPLETLRWAVPIHPTVSELIPTVLLDMK